MALPHVTLNETGQAVMICKSVGPGPLARTQRGQRSHRDRAHWAGSQVGSQHVPTWGNGWPVGEFGIGV